MNKSVLTAADIEHFLVHGFVKVSQALDQEVIKKCVDLMWKRLGYDPLDSSTWVADKIHMPRHTEFSVKDVAPRAYQAICELCGGEDRIEIPKWGDGFIANFHFGGDSPWVPPSPKANGWHKDGDCFLHFLDSPDQGLLIIVLWSDVHSRGGSTFVIGDSVGPVARYLADHPEGVNPNVGFKNGGFPHQTFVEECHDFQEATGKAGDVYLLHPFLLHASSINTLKLPRLITNPCVNFKEPMKFDRPNVNDHSPVELAILRALGKKSYSFKPTVPREKLIPERIERFRKLKEEEEARLAKKS
jgi:hypothetical protein